MSNYRRLISYIYAYEGGVKGKNIGFAKIEAKGSQCKITVSVKKVYVGSSDTGVYLLSGDQEIFLGNIFIRGGSGEFRTVVMTGDVEHSGVTLEQCFGLTVHDVENTWRSYTTIWEDAVAHAAELELPESGSRESGERAVTGILRKAVREIAEEFPVREKEAVPAVEYASELMPDVERLKENSAEKKSIFKSEEPDRILEGIIRPDRSETGAGMVLDRPSPEALETRAGSEMTLADNARAGSDIILEDGIAAEEHPFTETVPEMRQPVREPEIPKAPWPIREPSVPGQPSPAQMPIGDPSRPDSPAAGMLKYPNGAGGSTVCYRTDPLHIDGDHWKKDDEEAQNRNPGSLNNQRVSGGQRADGNEPTSANQPTFAGEPAFADGPAAANQPTFANQPPLSNQPAPANQFPHGAQTDTQSSNQPAGNPDSAGQPSGGSWDMSQVPAMEEPEEVTHDQIWEKMSRDHTKILDFDYEGSNEILTIKPKDIGLLSRENWVYGNNSFLLHGYYNYRYLILARLISPQGTVRYILGVPGHYFSNERYMASMFGFPNFVLSKNQPEGDDRFGYWYTDIRIGG